MSERHLLETRVERNVPVPMRDGTILRADVYRPARAGRYPTIVERTQFFRGEGGGHNCVERGTYFAPRGYVYVAQDVRGSGESEGTFSWHNEGWLTNRDGFDTLSWVAAQSFCDGNLGTMGGSGSGVTQNLLAPTRPPGLRAMSVQVGEDVRALSYRGGALLNWIVRAVPFWIPGNQHRPADEVRARAEKAAGDFESWLAHLPLRSYPPAVGIADWYFDVIDHPDDGPWWWQTDLGLKCGEVDAAVLFATGWFDFSLSAAIRHFLGIRSRGRSEAARNGTRLVIGPWGHGITQVTGELDFGAGALWDWKADSLRWFDHWLMSTGNGMQDDPPVRVFLMGDNRWLGLPSWPPPEAGATPLYFHEGAGRTDKSLNGGLASFLPPVSAERPDAFDYDPANPVLSLNPNGIEYLPKDHRENERRMLTFTTEVLAHPRAVMGPVSAVLYGMSSAPDTDWVVRLCDVWPDGRSMSVCDGILRARYRGSLERQELMVPGTVYRFSIDLWSTAQVFAAGHRIRVEVTSSDFPRFDANLNTGGPFGREVQGQAAVNVVFHDRLRPSHVVLPVVPSAV